MRQRLLAWTIAAVFLAGCIGETDGPKATSDLPAPTATKTEDTGGIQGRVVTDEVQPIAGAQVVLHQTNESTTTASDGGFAFSNLLPGDYNVIAVRLGYHQGAKRVTVLAGEIVEVQITLEAVPISGDQFNETMKFATTLLVNNLCEENEGATQGHSWKDFFIPVNQTSREGKPIHGVAMLVELRSSPNAATVDIDMYLYDPSGTQIGQGTQFAPRETILYEKKLKPGNHRLHVCLYLGTQAEITINVVVTYEET